MFRKLCSESRLVCRASMVTRARSLHPLASLPGRLADNTITSSLRAYATTGSSGSDSAPPSFMRNLFNGKLESSAVLPYPRVLDAEQEESLKILVPALARFFEESNDAAKNDQEGGMSDELWAGLKEMGACGIQVPAEYGGLNLSNTGYARLGEVLGSHDLGVSVALGAHQSIGFKGILLEGTEAQKAKYLPKVASGEWVAAFCLTEPSMGSDASACKTRAELADDGSGDWILNGGKIWISNGGLAEVMTVFAQTAVKQPDGTTKDKLTAFIVQRSFGGVTNGNPENKMGIKASNTTEVYFDNVRIPAENVLGQVGGGFKVAMAILNNGRFGMGAALAGTMRALIKQAAAHANQREQFQDKIRNFGLIRQKFAHMALKCYATESMAYVISANMDRGSNDYQLEAAAGKIFASDSAWHVADEAQQILGGMGYMRDTGIERVVRDSRIFRIFEGTNEILTLFIALTGAQSAGAALKQATKAPFADPSATAALAVRTLRSKLGMAPAKASSGSGGPSLPGAHVTLSDAAGKAAGRVAAFGAAVEQLLIKHGKKIVNEQMILKRVSEASIDLFAMTAVVSRASAAIDAGLPSAAHERLLADTFCSLAAERVDKNLRELAQPEKTVDAALNQIAVELLDNGEYIPPNPVD